MDEIIKLTKEYIKKSLKQASHVREFFSSQKIWNRIILDEYFKLSNDEEKSQLVWKTLSRFDFLIARAFVSINQLYKFERSVLDQVGNERCLSVHFGNYLEKEFENFNVDCEYTKCLGNPKRILMRNSAVERPDIIIHTRNVKEDNLFVFEIKHKNRATIKDIEKLKKLTEPIGSYSYRIGLFLNFEEHEVLIRIFIGGNEITTTPLHYIPHA